MRVYSAVSGIGRQDVKCGGFDTLTDGPVHRPLEDVRTVVVHPEDETAIDHHAELVQPADRSIVVATHILIFRLLGKIVRR